MAEDDTKVEQILEQANTVRFPAAKRPANVPASKLTHGRVVEGRPRITPDTQISIDELAVTAHRRLDQLDAGLDDGEYKYAFGHATDPADMAGRYGDGWRKVPFKEVKERLTEREMTMYQVKNNEIWYGDQDVLMRIPIRQYMAMQASRAAEHMSALGEAPYRLQNHLDELLYTTRGITKDNAPRIHVDTEEWSGKTQKFYLVDKDSD